MTHRPYTASREPSPTPTTQYHRSTHEGPRSLQPSYPTQRIMAVDSSTVIHLIEILGVFICAHKLWPKGITYGEAEEWETKHKKKSGHSSKSQSGSRSDKASGGSSSYGSRSDGRRQMREDRFRDREYDDARYARRNSARY